MKVHPAMRKMGRNPILMSSRVPCTLRNYNHSDAESAIEQTLILIYFNPTWSFGVDFKTIQSMEHNADCFFP